VSTEGGCQCFGVRQNDLLDELAPNNPMERGASIDHLAVAHRGVASGGAGQPRAALDDYVLSLEAQAGQATEELIA
jgi:hypothetical protein